MWLTETNIMSNGGKNKRTTEQRIRILSILFGVLAAFFCFLTVATVTRAVSFEDVSQTIGLGTADLKETVINIIRWALGLLGIVAVIIILYGGWVWMTAAGNEERVRRAKKILINATIGLVIVLLSWAIVAFVFDFGENVTNPGGDQCVEGTEQGCWDCISGEWVYDPTNPDCPVPPEDTFDVRNIVTSCEDPGYYRDNVFLCSGVTIVFNKVVKTDNLQSLIETVDPVALKVEQCGPGSDFSNCVGPSQPVPLFNDPPPRIAYSGSTPTGTRAEFMANGKAITFWHAHELFPQNTFFRLTIPKSIQSTDGKNLSVCRYQDGTDYQPCDDAGATFEWMFFVGDQNDTQPPTLAASYPRYDPSDRDRNVSRTPIIWTRFSEAIAPWTITEDNIKIYGFDPGNQPDDEGNGGARLGLPIDGLPPDPDNYDVTINPDGNGFLLQFINGFQLDAFRWYEIEVNNITDLCSNLQTPAPLSWRFETNGLGAGIATVYPPDGFQFSCPDTQVYVQFNTSMYDIMTGGCTVNPPLGFVTSGSPVPPRNPLEVEDDYPGTGDPNAYCKKYSYRPITQGLAMNTDFTVNVDTRYQINQDGDMLAADWSFGTAPAIDECANPPVIDFLAPDYGPAGTCLSVRGSYFDPDGDHQGAGDNDDITFSSVSTLGTVKRWSHNVIVLNAPDGSGASPVQVTVHYPDPIGDLQSNTKDFNYQVGDIGPCLIELNPDSGLRNQGYQLIGEDFNPASVVKEIHFGGTLACQNPPGTSCWSSDTVANSSVPSDAPYSPPDSDVWIANDAGPSNSLPFTVNQVPPGTFRVVDNTPTCTSSCPNAAVWAQFSKTLDEMTVTDNSVELYRCADENCAVGTLTEVGTNLQYTPGDFTVFFAQIGGLAVPDVWYRGVVHGGSSGVKSVGPDSLELGNLNFDSDGVGGPDSHSWIFKTASDTEACELASVECRPATVSIPLSGTRALQSRAFSEPNACNPAGQELDPWSFSWNWQSFDPGRVTVNPPAPDPVTTATGVQPTLPGTPVVVETATSGFSAICRATVTTNTCVVDDDCINNPLPGACIGSRCEDGVCTPTVTSFNPTPGAVGDWVTVAGCYFDNYVDGQSQVLFLQDGSSPDLVGLWPNPNVCLAPGSTWRDRQIIVEVPNKRDGDINDPTDDVLVTGPLRVIRGTDLETVDSLQSFDPSGPIHPGICRYTPASGQAGITRMRIQGQNFGAPPPAGTDGVVFYDGTPSGERVPGSDFDWVSDEEVDDVLVPQSAINNPSGGASPWDNDLELYLENDGAISNLVDFQVIPPSCTVCTTDTDLQCGGAAEHGCGQSGPFHCCANRPIVDTFGPVNPPATCRNAQIFASFVDAVTAENIAMNRTTINPSTVTLRNVTAGVDVVLPPGSFHFPSPSSFSVSPGLLEANNQYEVTIVGDENIVGQDPSIPEGVLSIGGVGMNGSRVWSFTTNDSICQLDRVVLVEDRYLFTEFGISEGVEAFTYDQFGQPIDEAPGVYDWSWQWVSTEDTVATVTNSDNTEQLITSVANGITMVRATAIHGDGWDGEKTGAAFVRVEACENPWPASGTPYRDPESPTTNFETWYCRDGNPLLPEVNPASGVHAPSQSGVDELIREFFFENPTVNPGTNKHDAVGMLVWENEGQLSPTAWYEKKFSKEAPGATAKVDGYESMRVGTTTYIAGTNLSNGTLYTNMYVLGYNDDAGSEISDIFNQMLVRLKLNINGSDFWYPGVPDYLVALEQVRRDTDRIGDLQDYKRALFAYSEKREKFPEFPAGSYIVNMSTSRWPSWAERLTAELQSVVPEEAVLHLDPKNDLIPACTDPFDPATCWDELGKRFACPDDSHIYAYQAASGGAEYDMFAHLEYLGDGTWNTGPINPCSAPSSCPCFNYQLTGTASGGGSGDVIPPSPPGNMTATTAGVDQIDLTWSLSTDTGGSGMQTYELYRSPNGTTWGPPFANVAHPNTAFSNSGLAPNTTYYYQAKARDFAGNLSGPSNVAQATTLPGSDIVPPADVTITGGTQGDGEVTITWTNPPNPPTDDYAGAQFWYQEGSGTFDRGTGTQSLPDITPSETSRTIIGLTNGTTYTFGIFAFDEVPNYAQGRFIQLTPQSGGVIQPITNFVATPGDAQISLTWVNSPAPYSGVMIRRSTSGYPADINDGTLVIDKSGAPSSPDSHLDQGLTNGTLYFYRAFAHDSVPNYAAGADAQATPQSGAPSIQQITNFVATPGDAQIFLTWVNSAVPYSGTMIRRSTSGYPSGPTDGTLVIDKPGAPSVPDSHLDQGLTNGTQYFYSAFAHDNVPNYATPGALAEATPDDGPPQITGVDVPMRNITRASIQIRWQTDELATSVVEIGTDPNQYEFGTFSDGNYLVDHSMTILGLQENVLYHFRVSSSDQAGNTTVGIDHVAVTDFRDDNAEWSGYFESPPSATWNGSFDAGQCGNDCNQYYTCNADRTPNCVDSQNAGIFAMNTCGAIAYADCLDGGVDLPHGQHALTDSVLDAWVNDPLGSHLPMLSQEQDACQNPPIGYGMPFATTLWSSRKGSAPVNARVWMGGACVYNGIVFVDDPARFMIVESAP